MSTDGRRGRWPPASIPAPIPTIAIFWVGVDAVSVVVPTPAHFTVSRDFLEHDVDVLIEKPMTTTLKEADCLIDISEARGLIVQVGHLERFNSAVVALNDIVKNPRFIESHRLSIYKTRCTDVSVVLDLMIHDIDIILNFVKSNVRQIHAAGIAVISGQVDIANARLEFENDCRGQCDRQSYIHPQRTQDSALSARCLHFGGFRLSTRSQWWPRTPMAATVPYPAMAVKQLCFTKGDALDDEIKSFVRAVTQREVPEVTGQMGRDALKIALNIMDQINVTNRRHLD